MWIILLDCSGSMGDPFSGRSTFEGRATPAKADIKLTAAKAALLERLPGLGHTAVALFAFTEKSSLVFEGLANEHPRIRAVLDTLNPNDGTDIAAALNAAFTYAESRPDEIILRLLVISDGLSDLEAAQRAAQYLAQRGAIIDVILIDPTDKGEAVARAIAMHGEVQAVTSSEALDQRIDEAVQQHAELQRRVDEAIQAHQRAMAEVTTQRSPEAEQVRFTVGYPGAISPDTWYAFLMFIHLESLSDQVRTILADQFVRQRLQARPHITEAMADSPLQRGVELTLTPRAEGLDFNPRAVPVTWEEDIQDVPFRFRAQQKSVGKTIPGMVDVYCQGVIIASVAFGVHVRQLGKLDEQAQSQSFNTSRVFQTVFTSYSHQDKEIVEAVVATYQALGIYAYLDTQALRGRGGQEWNILLRRFIRDSDLFQLYWSTSAYQSKYVEDEWHFAQSLAGQKGDAFIRPLIWEESPPSLPSELQHLHFEKLDLGALRRLTGHLASSSSLAATSNSVSVIPVAPVVPLLAGTRPSDAAAIEEDVRWAVGFLEAATGLRYYPVSTLLVDEYMVQNARRLLTTDALPDPAALVAQAVALGEIVQDIAMKVHIRFGVYSNKVYHVLSEEKLRQIYSGYLFNSESYRAFSSACESIHWWLVLESLNASSYSAELQQAGVKALWLERRDNTGWYRVRSDFVKAGVPGISESQELLPLAKVFLEHLCALLHVILHADEPHIAAREWTMHVGDRAKNLFNSEDKLRQLEVEFAGQDDYENLPVWNIRGSFPALVTTADWACKELLSVLRWLLGGGNVASAILYGEVPTFGIYVPAGVNEVDRQLFHWADERNIPRELTLPGRPRVLVCLDALPRLLRRLLQQGSAATADQGHTLQRLVLVHEHGHAIFELGLNSHGETARAAQFGEVWRTASALNESLAVWLELHTVRGKTPYEDWVWEYVRCGPYPDWPYRGAELVERQYVRAGMQGVRDLLDQFQQDAAIAQAMFDAEFN